MKKFAASLLTLPLIACSPITETVSGEAQAAPQATVTVTADPEPAPTVYVTEQAVSGKAPESCLKALDEAEVFLLVMEEMAQIQAEHIEADENYLIPGMLEYDEDLIWTYTEILDDHTQRIKEQSDIVANSKIAVYARECRGEN